MKGKYHIVVQNNRLRYELISGGILRSFAETARQERPG